MASEKTNVFKSYKGIVYLKVSECMDHFIENMRYYKLSIPRKNSDAQYFYLTFESNEKDLNKIKHLILEKIDIIIKPNQANIIELNMNEWFNLLTYGKLDLDFSLLEEDNNSINIPKTAYIDPGGNSNIIYVTT